VKRCDRSNDLRDARLFAVELLQLIGRRAQRLDLLGRDPLRRPASGIARSS
jgi:hypothetical protein